ncbi:MAG TPA: hypothetical protein VN132_06120 [Bdellovibrio sp.]|nr:hypothetical protein [Bdellovibrio sp.]
MKTLSIALCLLFSLNAFAETNTSCANKAIAKATSMLKSERRDQSNLRKSYYGEVIESEMLQSRLMGTLVKQQVLVTGRNSDNDYWQSIYSVVLSVPECKILSAYEDL